MFVDDADTAVVLDVSPYRRPPRWATAIVIADAALYGSADTSLAVAFADDDGDRDLLGRALIYRLVAEQLAGKSAPKQSSPALPACDRRNCLTSAHCDRSDADPRPLQSGLRTEHDAIRDVERSLGSIAASVSPRGNSSG